MARNFKREYELKVLGDEIVSIKNLRVSFEIERTSIGVPNKAEIVVYNPGNRLISNIKRDNKIIFEAGYEWSKKSIFSGEIRNVFHSRQGVDKIVRIYAADGSKDYREATINKTFSENVTVKKVVDEIISGFSTVVKGQINGLDKPADKLRGQSLSGSSARILDKLAEDYGFSWSIQDGEIIVSEEQKVIDEDDIVLISARTGMLGTPTITEIGADVNSLLNNSLIPNRLFKIEAVSSELQYNGVFFRDIKRTDATGIYRTLTVVHTGDTHGDDWKTFSSGISYNV